MLQICYPLNRSSLPSVLDRNRIQSSATEESRRTLLPDKHQDLRLVLRVGPDAGWDYHFKRAVAYVAHYCQVDRDWVEFCEDDQLGDSAQVEIFGELVATLRPPSPGHVVVLSLNDEFAPDGSYRVISAKDQTVLLEFPTFQSPDFGFQGPGGGQVVIHLGDLLILTLLRLIKHFDGGALPTRSRPHKLPPTLTPCDQSALEAATLYRSVDFNCWQSEVLTELSEDESEKLWMGVFAFDSVLESIQYKLLEACAEKYSEARSCVTYFRRDVIKLLQDKPVEISRGRAIRYVLERMASPFYRASFYRAFFKLCTPELRNEIMSSSNMNTREQKLVVSHFVAYCERQSPLKLESKIWWKTQLRAYDSQLSDMLAANTMTQQVTHDRLSDRALRNPQRVLIDLLTWNGQMNEVALTEFEKLACLCDYLGPEGASLRADLTNRLGELPTPPEVSEFRKAQVCSQLYSRFQSWLAKKRTPKKLACTECGETFKSVRGLFAHNCQ